MGLNQICPETSEEREKGKEWEGRGLFVFVTSVQALHECDLVDVMFSRHGVVLLCECHFVTLVSVTLEHRKGFYYPWNIFVPLGLSLVKCTKGLGLAVLLPAYVSDP